MAKKARQEQQQFSIAEARADLAALVHRSEEQGGPIELTRRGRAVAVILSVAEYRRLAGKKRGPWAAIEEFRKTANLDDLPDEGEDLFAGIRSREPGREHRF